MVRLRLVHRTTRELSLIYSFACHLGCTGRPSLTCGFASLSPKPPTRVVPPPVGGFGDNEAGLGAGVEWSCGGGWVSERGEDAGQFEEVGNTVMGSVGDEEEESEDDDGDDEIGGDRMVHREAFQRATGGTNADPVRGCMVVLVRHDECRSVAGLPVGRSRCRSRAQGPGGNAYA